ncbi:MAG: hypothetical protein ACXWF8_08270 [Methylobacter sp.]
MKYQLYVTSVLMFASGIAWADPHFGGYGQRYGAANIPPSTNPPQLYGSRANPYAADPVARSYRHYVTPHTPYSVQQPYGYAPYSTPNPYRAYVNPYSPDADNTRYDAASPYDPGNVANPYGVYGRAGMPVYPYLNNRNGASGIANPGAFSPSLNGYYQGYPYQPNLGLQFGGTINQLRAYQLGLGFYGR